MTISNYRAVNKNTLIAAFDLQLDSGIAIYGAMLHRKENSGEWISFPGKPYQKDGATLYAKVIDIPDRDRRDAFNAQVIQTLKDEGHI